MNMYQAKTVKKKKKSEQKDRCNYQRDSLYCCSFTFYEHCLQWSISHLHMTTIHLIQNQ